MRGPHSQLPSRVRERIAEAVLEPSYADMGPMSQGLLTASLCLDVDHESLTLSEERIEAGKDSLIEFAKNCNPRYRDSWHHRELARALEELRKGTITRLLVMMPPRHGKSELVSRMFPAWCLGHDPGEHIMACSYSVQLASRMGRDVQRIMGTDAYLDTFSTRLRATNGDTDSRSATRTKQTQIEFEVANGTGAYICGGVDAGFTGSGLTLGIVDDPVKNRGEAESETVQRKRWEFFTSSFLTRGEGAMSVGGEERIVVCMTPWSEADLSGKILRHAKETGEEWVVIRMPAIREPDQHDVHEGRTSLYVSSPGWVTDQREVGEPLWPEKYPADQLEKKKSLSARDWTSMYQCRPAPDEGNIFHVDWWQWYERDEMPRMQIEAFSIDAAFKDLDTGSYVVLQHWGIKEPHRYLIEQWRGHMDFPTMLDLCERVFEERPHVATKLIEEKANGAALISMLSRRFSGIVPIRPKDPKHVRALAVQSFVEGGNVWLPKGDSSSHMLVEEARAFPFGAHDDQVDAMTQFLQHYSRSSVGLLRRMTGTGRYE